MNHARRQTEEEARLMGGLQSALDRVHTTDHETVAQTQVGDKMISELRDGHNRIRSPLETARAMNEDNPGEMQGDRGGLAATQTQADSVRILEGILALGRVNAPSRPEGTQGEVARMMHRKKNAGVIPTWLR